MPPPLRITVPGGRDLALNDLVLDFNGTLALDGQLLPGVGERLRELAKVLRVHVLTADTHGTATQALAGLPLKLHLIQRGTDKRAFAEELGAAGVVAVGNGRNDVAMLEVAALGVAVTGPEGAAGDALAAADIVVPDIRAALELLLHPLRVTATLRE